MPHPFVIEVAGRDASQVVNNLSTNNIAKLPIDAHHETFITDVRGWVVAHAMALKQPDRVWLIGSHESPSKICNHIDRYIIREQAAVHDHSATHSLLIIGDGDSEAQPPAQHTSAAPTISPLALSVPCLLDCAMPVLGTASRLLCLLREHIDQAVDELQGQGAQVCSDELFQWLRISSFWPLSPADIGDKTIPQELDRDSRAISFTKGCYLGQETIARLDARGQLQKKLCLVELIATDEAQRFEAGDKLMAGDKEVGQLTSLARLDNSCTWRALGLLRRGNFAPGTQLTCHGQPAQVLPPLE